MNEQNDQLVIANQAIIEALAQVIGQQRQIVNILKELEKEKGKNEKNTELIYQSLSRQAIKLIPSDEMIQIKHLMEKNIEAINREEKILHSNSNLKFLVWGWGFLVFFLLISMMLLKFGNGL